jgi:hypothetical protein
MEIAFSKYISHPECIFNHFYLLCKSSFARMAKGSRGFDKLAAAKLHIMRMRENPLAWGLHCFKARREVRKMEKINISLPLAKVFLGFSKDMQEAVIKALEAKGLDCSKLRQAVGMNPAS